MTPLMKATVALWIMAIALAVYDIGFARGEENVSCGYRFDKATPAFGVIREKDKSDTTDGGGR